MTEKSKKLPRGNKKNPWYHVPEHIDSDRAIPSHFILLTKDGIHKALDRSELPTDAVIQQDISY